MELSQSRPFETAQGKKATHDFLSLYTHSSVQLDARPSHQGGFLKTHNFLQPSEGEEKNGTKEDNSVDINLEKAPPAALPPSAVQHILPSGIGTYSISHITYLNPRLPKSEENVFTVASVPGNGRNDENSNCSSYSGSGFTLWDESNVRKRNSGKENLGNVNVVKEPASEGQWSLDQPTQFSPNHRTSVSPLSSSQSLVQKNQSFVEMIKSAKGANSKDNDEEILSQSSSLRKGELRLKVDGRSCDQKPNTPRSKHSATEQRRRCKINDRLQKLRGLIPQSDQKRDKASFLLEVIEYIQFLQEKVNRYEGYPKWNSESTDLNTRRAQSVNGESTADRPQVSHTIASPMLMFGAKLDETTASPPSNISRITHIPTEHNATNTIDFKTIDQQPGMTYKPVSSSSHLQSNLPSSRPRSDTDVASLAQLQLWQNSSPASEPATTHNLKDQEHSLEGGTINISSIYSHGLLNTLTQALQSSGVDLSQARISVEVDIGKRANYSNNDQNPTEKKVDEAPRSNQCSSHSKVESTNLESDRAVKRLKTI